MTTAGYSLESVVDAFKLSNSYKLLKKDDAKAVIDNDKPDVDEGGEVTDAPDPNKIDGITPLDKANKVQMISQSDKDSYINQLRIPARKLMNTQVEAAVASLDVNSQTTATKEEKDVAVEEMMKTVRDILLYGGAQQWQDGKMLLMEHGIDAPDGAYDISEAAVNRYREYLQTIVDSYAEGTDDAIRAVLDRANETQATTAQMKLALREIMNTDEWRVVRLATSEVNRSGALSGVEAMMKIQEESEATLEKSMMTTSGNPCEFCRARVGNWYAVDSVMIPKGSEVQGVDGGVMVNQWDDNAGHDIHANGECTPIYRVVRND